MPKKKRLVTLVGKKQARKGFKFIFSMPSAQCENCEYRQVCVEKLEPERVYQVVRLRENVFPCPLHEEGVRVVEVVEAEVSAAIPSKLAVEGATIVFKIPECEAASCENAALCYPVGLKNGDKCLIVGVEKKLSCAEGFSLVKARLRRVSSDKSR